MASTLRRAVTPAAMLLALAGFCWPLFVASKGTDEGSLAQLAFGILIPVLLVVVLSLNSERRLNPRQLAILGVLIAVDALVRMLGAGIGGVETVFCLIVISGYVFGSSFGVLMASGTLLLSALLTGGVGPWLPFQMMAAAVVGYGAGLIPKVKQRWLSVTMLVTYAVPASYLYGALMTLWNWPFLAGTGSGLSYLPGAGPVTNLLRFLNFELVTGGLLWDTGRALTTAILLALSGPALLTTLKRAARRARIENTLATNAQGN